MIAVAVAGTRLAEAYEHCEALTRRAASNFAWAFRLLPYHRRLGLCAVYAFCRAADDFADEPGAAAEPRRLLARWRAELDAAYAGRPQHPIGIALADTVARFAVPREHLAAVIDGVEMDLTRDRYETWEGDLADYCYRVAAAVGLVCIEVFGYQNPSARQYAVHLGLALQLTNILRDVAEDARRGRIYLPRADLRRFECREEDVLAGRLTEPLRRVMAFECARAGEHYGRARFLLAEEDRQSLAAAEAMRLIYEQLLRRIMLCGYDVFGTRVRLTQPEKAGLAVSAWVRPHLRFLYRLAG